MTVELVDHMGNDLSVVNAARVSPHRRATEMGEVEAGLIRYMLREHHATPFEHVVFTFRVRTPIRVAREWARHRTDSFNEESTRYVEMRQDFYVPQPGEGLRTQRGKPGQYRYEPLYGPEAEAMRDDIAQHYESATQLYYDLLIRGLAKEAAAWVLPLGLLTEFIWTVKLRHALHFLALRTAPSALLEMRKEAHHVEAIVAELCPVSYTAWHDVNRPLLDSDWD